MADRMKLTKTAVHAVEPQDGKTRFVWDTDLRGFGLRVTGTGVKAFIYQQRAGKKERRVTLGRFPDMSPEVARKRARGLVSTFADGVDPVAERKRSERRGMTLQQAFDAYREAPVKKGGGKGQPKKEQTRRDIDKAGKRFSDWMEKAVTEITGDMVKERYAKIAAKSPAQANLAMRYLRAALNHVNADSDDDEPIIARNPVDRLSRASLWKPVQRAEGRIPAERLADWVDAVQTGLVGLKHEREHRDALLFILLTGCRHSEALGNKKDGYPALAWSDVDLFSKRVTFRHTKNGKDHVLPIGPKLAAILEARQETAGPDFVFSNAKGEISEDLRSAINRVKNTTGIQVTAHDLRRTFLSVATAKVGLSEYMVKALANHGKTGDVTAGYVQITVEDMRDAMTEIESVILSE